MRRRVRLTEGQLRNVVEEASRRVIQEMMNEGWFDDALNVAKEVGSGLYYGLGVNKKVDNAVNDWNNGWIANQTGWKIPNYTMFPGTGGQQAYARKQQAQQQAKNN